MATSVGQIGLDLVVNQKPFNKQMTGMQSLAKKAGAAMVAAFSVKKLVDFGKQCIELSSDLQEVQNVVSVTFPSMTQKVDDFADSAAASFGLSETMAKKFTGTFGSMAKAFDFTEQQAYDMGTTLTGLAGDVASFYNLTQDQAYTKLKSVFTGETESLKDLGVVMTQTALDSYALANGFGKTIKSMSEAEKVSLRYAFVQDQLSAAQGDFLRTSDSWANQTRLLKLNLEQLGATIGGSLINAFKPLLSTLNVVIGKFTEFAKVVSDSLGKIFGWKYEESGGGITADLATGAGSANDIASGIGNAADNAKKLKQQLQGFDELNVLTTNSSSGTGSNGTGGGSTGSTESASSGQWTKTDSIFKGYESELDTLYKLGEHIGATITKSLNGIDWESVYQGAKNFGSGLASFLNGLISPELFGAVGKTIAGSLNTAIKAALSFGQTFDFYEFGQSIATGINEFFKEFDAEDLAATLNTWVNGLEDTIAGFLKTLKWDDILAKTGEFLGDLELDTVGIIIGAFVLKNSKENIMLLLKTSILNSLGSLGITLKELIINGINKIWFTSYIKKNFIGEVLAQLPGTTSNPITLQSIVLSISSFILGANGIGTAAFDSVAGNIILKIDEALGKLIPDWAKDTWNSIVMGIAGGAIAGSWIPGFGTIAGAIVGGILGALGGTKIDGKSILMHIVDGIFNWDYTRELSKRATKFFENAWECFQQGDWIGIGANIIDGIIQGILGGFAFLAEPFADLFTAVFNGICKVFGIHSPATKMKPLGQNILLGVVEGFLSSFGNMTAAISEFFNNVIKPWFSTSKWKESIGSIKDALVEKWNSAKEWWNNKPALKKISTTIENLKTKVSNAWTSARTWWNENKPSLNKISVKVNSITSALSTAWNAAKSWWDRNKPSLSQITAKIKMPHLKVTWDTSSWSAKALQKLGLKGFPNFSVAYYAQGGFPEDGWFRAKHGEIMGKFDNGKSVVANNTQITEGISNAVYRGNQESNALMRQEILLLQRQNELLMGILEKEVGISSDDVFNSVRKSADSYTRRTGKPAFGY